MNETVYIDDILKAEHAANEVINSAQKQRQRKVKEAKQAAERQVSRYREQKQNELQSLREKKEDREFEIQLQHETAEDINKIEKDFQANKDKVVKMLVQKVLQVDLSIPTSVKEKFIKSK